MRVDNLEGNFLDYWVARAEDLQIGPLKGVEDTLCAGRNGTIVGVIKGPTMALIENDTYWPSRDWDCGGPIIERQKLRVGPKMVGGDWYGDWEARAPGFAGSGRMPARAEARSPLIAAMRALVASKFGEEVPEVML